MRFYVYIYTSPDSSDPDISTPIEVPDSIMAALAVMHRFGLQSAASVYVYNSFHLVAEFHDIDLSQSVTVSIPSALSYDYGM